MKMVKSLLLGSAAGVVAVAGAQAADLPVKAKAVEYVKICSLYGAGFYYMPGTNLCIKIGGYVRYQAYFDPGGNGTFSGLTTGFLNTRTGGNQDFVQRHRTIISADVRTQTEYGTLRAYMNVGHSGDGTGPANDGFPGTALYANRAFLQFAGFTMGLASSYYDFYSQAGVAYLAAHPGSDTGDGGWKLIAYTWQLGNGVSATLAAEEPRRTSIWNVNTTNFGVAVQPATAYGNSQVPDIVGNIRVDQAWGAWQVMGALHQVRVGYYNNTLAAPFSPPHADDDWGYAVGTGIRIKMDYITPGSFFQGQVTYAHGAIRYLAHTPFGNTRSYGRFSDSAFVTTGLAPAFANNFQGTVGIGPVMDAIYTSPTGFPAGGPFPLGSTELTSGWTLNLSYEHRWNQAWKTSVYGGYMQIDYSNAANFHICNNNGNQAFGFGSPAGVNPRTGCDADWSTWWIGSRTQWNITPAFYLGVDVLYNKLNTMDGPTGANWVFTAPGGPRPAGNYLLDDQSTLSATFRAHFDFLP